MTESYPFRPNYRKKISVGVVGILVSLITLSACEADDVATESHDRLVADVSLDPQDNYLEHRQYFLDQVAGSVTPADASTMENGRDSNELMSAALRYASSRSANDLRELEQRLIDVDFLNRLDNVQDYQGTYAGLRLAGVMGVLADNPEQYAHNIPVNLTDNAVFQAHILRLQLLALVLGEIRPASEQAIAYWAGLSEPGSPLTFDVVAALCTNQSDAAMDMLASLFADPDRAERQKLVWLRQIILPRRNDLGILRTSEVLLKESMPEHLRAALVEVLFDYQPAQWYLGSVVPEPPDRSEISIESEAVLRRIADYALENVALSDNQRASVRDAAL